MILGKSGDMLVLGDKLALQGAELGASQYLDESDVETSKTLAEAYKALKKAIGTELNVMIFAGKPNGNGNSKKGEVIPPAKKGK